MIDQSRSTAGGSQSDLDAQLEARLRAAAAVFPYPATPDLAAREHRRITRRTPEFSKRHPLRAGLVIALLAVTFTVLLLATPVRARLVEWIRIGAVRIFFTEPGPTPTLITATGTPVPQVTATFLQSVLDLDGQTSLSAAQQQLAFPILLPERLGLPELVYVQEYDQNGVILVWVDPNQPGRVRLSLTQAPSGTYIFEKYVQNSVVETQVNGQPAVWVEGEYPMVTRSGDLTMTRLITQGHTLIWTQGRVTYRLETDEELETAIEIAESLREMEVAPQK